MLLEMTTNAGASGQAIATSFKGATYHGADPKNAGYRIKTNDGLKLLLLGIAYELKPHSPSSGKHSFKRVKIGTTQDYIACPTTDSSFVAVCKKTNKRIRLIGKIKFVVGQADQETTAPIPITTPGSCSGVIAPVVNNSAPINQAPVDTKQRSREKRQLARFQRELEIINAQCQAGLNPAVSIAAMGYMSHRSLATIYRDIKKQLLPRPTKIGRNSTFPFSIAKAYADGQFVGGAV